MFFFYMYLRIKESLFEYYEVIILLGAWSNQKKDLIIDFITLRPKSPPHNIQRMISCCSYLYDFLQLYDKILEY